MKKTDQKNYRKATAILTIVQILDQQINQIFLFTRLQTTNNKQLLRQSRPTMMS